MSTESIDAGSQNPSQETVEQTQVQEQPSAEQAQVTEQTQQQTEAPTQETVSSSNPLAVQQEEKTEEQAEEKKPETVQSEGAPEQYGEFKAPEGVELNAAVVDCFKGVAKKLNLSQTKAQEVIDEISPIMAAQQVEMIKQVSAQWLEASKKDPEIGGSKYDASIQKALKVRDRFGKTSAGSYDPDIAALFSLPVGSHPGFIKFLARIGDAISEDSAPKGQPSGRITPQDIYGI